MTAIPSAEIVNLRADLAIHLTTAAGEITIGTHKDGTPAIHAYAPGEILLMGRNIVLLSPFDAQYATDIAMDVLTGNARTITDSKTLSTLATTVLLMAAMLPEPDLPLIAAQALQARQNPQGGEDCTVVSKINA